MQAIILAATHERVVNADGKEVPLVLVDLEGKPQLTVLLEKLSKVNGLNKTIIVTNEAIKPKLDNWASTLPQGVGKYHVISDGTKTKKDRKGAIGDIRLVINHFDIHEDLLVVGGDNWFRYDIAKFVEQSRNHSPAVVVTKYEPILFRSSRFGLVKMKGNRIEEFLEKPKSTSLNMKASCVYFFSASDLRWINDFAEEHLNTLSNYTPGDFFAWLVNHKIAVYGVEMEGWYDIGKFHDPHPGPDFFAIRDKIRRDFSPNYSTWQKQVLLHLELISSYADLLDYLKDNDPNIRIVSTIILGHIKHLIDPKDLDHVISELLKLLADPSQNQIGDSFQCDEEEAYYVAATAADALVSLGYAKDEDEVFEKAEKARIPIVEVNKRKNIY